MTPYELSLVVSGYTKRKKQEAKDQLSNAWMTAYFHRVKKMPELAKLLKDLDKPPKPKKQTPEDMLEKVMALNAKFGGTVVKG